MIAVHCVKQVAKTAGCYPTAFCIFFRLEVVWLPVLQLSEAEDAYAPHGATFGSRFQSSSLGPSGARETQSKRPTI